MDQFDGSYFAAISKGSLFNYAIDAMVAGKVSFTDTSIAPYIPEPIEHEDDVWDDDAVKKQGYSQMK